MKSFTIPLAWLYALTSAIVFTILAGTLTSAQHPTPIPPRPPAIDPSTFYLLAFNGTSLHGKCLDFGSPPQVAGSPVFIFGCNGTVSQQVRVEEINARHEVILHAGSKAIGIRNPATNRLPGAQLAPAAPTQFVLELQDPPSTLRPDFGNQIFGLDGDSIILASSHSCIAAGNSACPQLVVQVENALSANRSPLIVGPRNLAESEFWTFQALDHTDRDPTRGFQRVSTIGDLLKAMNQINQVAQQNNGAAWGNVIKIIDTGNAIDLTDYPASYDASGAHNMSLPTGVTVRGDRRGTLLGPQLLGLYKPSTPTFPAPTMFYINGHDVRITGLRLQGVTTSTTATIPSTDAITAHSGVVSGFVGTAIDHNDISAWTSAGVEIFGDAETKGGPGDGITTCRVPDPAPADRVRIDRNFIHHNDEDVGNGYGIVTSYGGIANILGNTFLMNRHSIAGDGSIADQYTAWFNLVLSRAPVYYKEHLGGLFKTSAVEQTFDMHGAFGGYGGYAGNEIEVAWNTFLPAESDNFDVRGQSCDVDFFHNNVSTRSNGNAIQVWDASSGQDGHYITSSTQFVHIQNNQFSNGSPGYSDPTIRLGVGNFDGDAVQDLFLATGAAWYYSPAGKAEWRYLNGGKTDRIDSLLLGDFDGDGRTDVIGKNGNDLMISWGGVSDWQKINSTGATIKDLAVGDFDGDGRADLFYGDGTSWYVSSGASGLFKQVQTSSFRVKDLRFGHFTTCDFEGRSKTDVMGIVAGKWQVSCGATGYWTPLPVSLTSSIDGLIVADFDGNGHSDIAIFSDPFVVAPSDGSVDVTNWNWAISHDAAAGWTYHDIMPTTQGPEPCPLAFATYQLPPLPQQPQQPLTASASSLFAAVGRFAGNAGADILLWGSTFANNFCIVPGGTGPAVRQSRQDMR